MRKLLFLLSYLVINSSLAADNHVIRMATTTSTDNSGLLNVLLPAFENDTGIKVHVIAVGTGKALRMGEAGDADVVLVHARAAEDRFMEKGFGVNRKDVMYNDFVLVGPGNDPASVRATKSIAEAFQNIAKHQNVFISRGDNSGTHKKELQLWEKAATKPEGQWYREAGQGMGKVLQMSAELSAYTLTDRGTWLAMRNRQPLQIVFEGDSSMFNPYGIMAVNPKRHKHTNFADAQKLIDWITAAKGQKMIGDFKINGERLFSPNAMTAGK